MFSRSSVRFSQYFLPTIREQPAEAEVVSHRLMLRAGMIRQAAAGIYNWLPLGQRVLQNVADLVRDEQNRAGAHEMLMPTIQQADLWRRSGRYDDYGKEMLRIRDRQDREMLFGPTNEEQITDLFAQTVRTYRALPQMLYHIQWKFRDELRPRFGVMRGREFLMKDGYSFDYTAQACRESYNRVFVSYLRTLDRMGLKPVPIRAPTGQIGGDLSHEFAIRANTGEVEISCDRRMINLPVPATVDYDHDDLNAIVAKWTEHYAVNDEAFDGKTFESRVPSEQRITTRAIEVAHVFSFGTKYSAPLEARVECPDGKHRSVHMGSYGIGVSRLVAAIIEASHDEQGIVWPPSVAPFVLHLLCLQTKDLGVLQVCNDLFAQLDALGLSVLYDERDERPGVKFADADLIGCPWQVIVGKRGLATGHVDVKHRPSGRTTEVGLDSLVRFLTAQAEVSRSGRPSPSNGAHG